MTTPGAGADAQDGGLRESAIEGLRWLAIARPVIEVVLLGSMIVLTRLVPPADFGRLAIALIFAEVAMMLPSEGIGSAIVQRDVVSREHLQAGFAMALIAAVVLGGASLVVAALVVAPLFGERTAGFVRMVSPIFLLSAIATVPLAILRRRLAFRVMSVIDVTSTIIRAGLSVGLALAAFDGEALVMGALAGCLVTMTLALASARPPLPWLRRAPAADLLRYGVPAGLASASWVGFRNCDYAIVGARLGLEQGGFYFRAYTLGVEYQKKISLVMGQVGFPLLARATTSQQRSAMRAEMVRMLTVALFPGLVLLAVLAPQLVPWLFGEAWAPATTATQILALGGAATLVIDAAGAVLQADGRARALLGYGLAHFVMYAAVVLVASNFGLAGVAVGASAVHVAFLWVAYALMLRGSGERPLACLWSDVKPATVASLTLACVAVPASLLLDAAGTPALAHMSAVTALSIPVYVLTLRWGFPRAWQVLIAVLVRVLPVGLVRPRGGRAVAGTEVGL